MKIIVKALIKDKYENYLFLRRSSNNTYPGFWEIPGGNLDPNENLTTGLLRELQEETGLTKVDVDIDFNKVFIDSFLNVEKSNELVINIIYFGQMLTESTIITAPEEHDSYAFMTTEQIKKLELRYSLQQAIDKIFP